MSDYQAPPAPPDTPPPAPPLMRREQNKVVAGVCSGVAYRLGIDPNVVRVVTVVLAIFGGAGVLLYALGWLLMPEERTGQSLGERALRGGGPNGAGAVVLALALGLVVVGFGFGVVGDSWFGVAVLAVAVGVGAVLLSRTPSASRNVVPPVGPPPPGPLPTPAQPGAWPGAAPAQPAPYGVTDPLGAPSYSSYYPDYPDYPDYPGYPYGPVLQAETPPQAKAPRPRSMLGPLTLFAALATVGVLGLVDVLGARVPVAGYVAAALAVVGLGLVVGAWFGRSRGLIALGVALSVLLVPIATVEHYGLVRATGDPFESVLVEPTRTEELDGTNDEYGAGEVRYDLTAVEFEGTSVDAQISMGAGELVIDLPPDVTLVLDAAVGAGEIDVFGSTSSGLAVSDNRTFGGDEGAGTLRLDVRMGFGSLEVNREDA
jgi:phage shock protein PspC (stress-responsive transcriptional regulator)